MLRKRLEPHGYFELPHTPGLWKHTNLPVQFLLVVDDFGVKYVGKQNALHLVNALKQNYKISKYWTGGLYCGISLRWNYDKGCVDTAMPTYVTKQLLKYKHEKSKKPQDTLLQPAPRIYGTAAQNTAPPDTSPPLNKKDKNVSNKSSGVFCTTEGQ